MRFLDVPIRSFNIELTSRCVLACPACARTGNEAVLASPADLPLGVLEHAFPLDRLDAHRGLKVNLCGSYGDCAYHPRFHQMLEYLKQAGLSVMVETNGSHRKPQWWRRTCELLGPEDSITFSVDGLADTNHRYRVNARWSDIEAAMRYAAARVTVDWKYIVFRHNEHQLDEARALAQELGVRSLTFKKSGRFEEGDPLAPENEVFIGTVARNRRRIRALLDTDPDAATLDAEVRIVPKCQAGKDLSISSWGYLYPCSPCESRDESSWFFRNRDHFDLRRHSLDAILASSKWRELEGRWRRASTAPQVCFEYCGLHRDYAERYRSESRPDRPGKPEDVVEGVRSAAVAAS